MLVFLIYFLLIFPQAMTELDGKIFQGRLLHLLPAKGKPESTAAATTNAAGAAPNANGAANVEAEGPVSRGKKGMCNNI